MTESPRIMPGERIFTMPPGTLPRGGTFLYPKDQRELAAKEPNPIKPTEASLAVGRARYQTFCVPCHGAEAKGGVTGPVAVKFIPPPDLTNADLQKARTDGTGTATSWCGLMPSYRGALSSRRPGTSSTTRTLAAR
jgi:mono/diheme cytochrome c family protein